MGKHQQKRQCSSSTQASSLVHYESDIEGEDGVANNEEVIESMLSASGADTSKVKVKSWKDLWEQLKDDIVDAHKKQATLTTINQLLLLRNFAML